MKPTLLFFGMGAIGSVFALFSKRAGFEVCGIARETHAEAISREGLQLKGIFGEDRVDFPVYCSVKEMPVRKRFDLLFLTVKAYDTESALQEMAPLLLQAEAVVSLQNGLLNDRKMEKVVSPEKVVLGRVIFGAELEQAGVVRTTVIADATRVGQKGGAENVLLQMWCSKITKAGLPTEWTGEVERYIYDKALYNCALNPLGTLLKRSYGQLADNSYCREVMDSILKECLGVIEKKGIAFPYALNEYRQHFYEQLLPPTRDHFPSMLRDIERRGRTEIRALNGAFVEMGKEGGGYLPFNQGMVWLIEALEEKQKHPEWQI